MRKISVCAAAFGLAVGAAAVPAEALVCNIVFDRNDQMVYRDTAPPVDLSDSGARARAAMRQRGEYLMVIDTDRCVRVVPATASSGAASVEDIVAGMRPYLGASGGRATSGGQAAGGVASNARAAPPAAVSSSRGSSSRAY
ncbi:MAG TPA: hypothetical protein VIH15_13715 [Casimicrobiaceae bacterium]|jgi:hypothetical protein